MDYDEKAMWNRLTDNGSGFFGMQDQFDDRAVQHFVKSKLHQGTMLIEFIKSDGTVRAMNCTLSESHGAQHKIIESTETVNNTAEKPLMPVNDAVCRVWDIEHAAWRSFRWDRLKRIEFKIG
jgi:hypothetical protein